MNFQHSYQQKFLEVQRIEKREEANEGMENAGDRTELTWTHVTHKVAKDAGPQKGNQECFTVATE